MPFQRRFEAAILDVNLPHYDGLSVASYLSENTDMAIVMITGRDSSEDRVRGYLSGADIYLVKPVDCDELSAALSTLTRKRRQRTVPGLGNAERWLLDRTTFQLREPEGGKVLLTRRETQLLERMSRELGVVVPRQEILALLGYDGSDPGSRALDAAISRLRAKVHTETGATLPVQTVQGVGFVFSGSIGLA